MLLMAENVSGWSLPRTRRLPSSALASDVGRMRGLFVTAAVLALLAALVLGAFAVRRVATPVEDMRQVSAVRYFRVPDMVSVAVIFCRWEML